MLSEDEAIVKRIVKEEIAEHREAVEDRMNLMHGDISVLRQDMHKIASTVSEMNVSLQKIAANSAALADWSQTWVKVKNFWDVINWFKKNWFVFVLLGGLIYVALWFLGVRVQLK